LREPAGPGIRLDSGVYPGWTIPLEYDPLLAKLVVFAPDRKAAVQRMLRALREYSITGVETNLGFFREILEDPEFVEGRLSTNFIPDYFARRHRPQPPPELQRVAAAAAAAHSMREQKELKDQRQDHSRWLTEGRSEQLR